MYQNRRSDNDRQHGSHMPGQKRKSDPEPNHSTKKPRMDSGNFKPSGAAHRSNGQNGLTKHDAGSPRIANDPLPELPSIAAEYEGPVFTHASMTPLEYQQGLMQSYDRLEFLGDAYLEIIASRLIWSLYKDNGFSAARMSQVRESLVKNETLSEFSLAYGFDTKLKISHKSGTQTHNATTKIKLNGDVFEAYVAAVVLSDPLKGFETAEDWLTQLWEPKLRNVSTTLPDEKSKGNLQKRIGAKGIKLDYIDERPAIVDKKRGIETYFVGVYLTGWGYEKKHLGSGEGQSKKAAGMAAAKKALENTELIEQCSAMKLELQAKPAKEEKSTQG